MIQQDINKENMILIQNRFMSLIKPFCILVFIFLVMFGCKKEPIVSEGIDINIILQSGDTYEYDFFTDDEEGAVIQIQASNYAQSEIIRDQSTNMSAVYFYQPINGYAGADFVQIQKNKFNVSMDEEETQLYRFSFTIE